MRTVTLLMIMGSLLMAVGCDDELNKAYTTEPMLQRGIVYILPGIQGVDYHYKDIRNGLIGAGINCAIKIHPWGCQIPGLNLAVNETNVLGNRAWGKRIAKEIAAYQQQFPGRRIYMIGQSGGAGVSIFTAEALADLQAPPIEGLVLLDASVSNDYNLTKALSVCREGIVNFYNEKDTALLGFGTAVMGNVDGGHAPSAGRVGFKGQYPKLYNVRIRPDMIDDFADPHFADCSQAFASQYLAPWIIDHSWPPGHLQLGMAK